MNWFRTTIAGFGRGFGWAVCALSVLALFAAALSGHAAERAAAPSVEDAWVRPSLAPGRPAAGYMVVVGGAVPDRLVAVTSLAARVELHETMAMENGAMRMDATPSVPVPAGARVAFAPGGRHLMLFGLKPDMADVPLALHFASGRVVGTIAHAKLPGNEVAR